MTLKSVKILETNGAKILRRRQPSSAHRFLRKMEYLGVPL